MVRQGRSFDPFEFYGGELDGDAWGCVSLIDSTFSTLFSEDEKVKEFIQTGSK